MKKEVSLRQIAYMFLLLTISPILRQIPSILAGEAGRSGYLSPLWSIIVLVPLTAIILLLIKSFPGLNLYEIMEHLMGKFPAKVFIIGYIFWILLQLTAKINIYSLTLQFTLMPRTRSNLFMAVMMFLVYYALLRGMKTIFRFSEFVLGPVLAFFAIMMLCALPKVRLDYLLRVSTIQLPATIMAAKSVISAGGIIIIALFFADKLNLSITKKQKRKLWYSVLFYVLLTFVITVFTFGITGADLTANLPFPFYITVKSISFFNVLERFEVLVTLICVLSDFIFICILSTLLMRCIQWLFNVRERGFLFVPLAMIVFYLTYFVSQTQFEFNYLYRTIIMNLDLIFLYLIPFFLGLLCLAKRKNIRKQY